MTPDGDKANLLNKYFASVETNEVTRVP